ncbi:hypothetical protein E2562_004033 [Oryza meyeriana var. granulata]|uniref:Uncharacterized protein n=1 Tax=Oryza meyeriana var. granulata TaxID=110450 RepID=A0A6G1BJ49_9ORYZ|nr:hypothetical protein E2562_004033 [Oryza meyeriana var. granulata]
MAEQATAANGACIVRDTGRRQERGRSLGMRHGARLVWTMAAQIEQAWTVAVVAEDGKKIRYDERHTLPYIESSVPGWQHRSRKVWLITVQLVSGCADQGSQWQRQDPDIGVPPSDVWRQRQRPTK